MTATSLYEICHICRRSAYGLLKGKKEVCKECPPLPIVQAKQLDVYEQCAIAEVVGGAAARFVLEHGTDLAEWGEDVAFEFAKLIFVGVGDSVRSQVRSGKAPF